MMAISLVSKSWAKRIKTSIRDVLQRRLSDDQGPKGPIVLSFEFQLNRWGVCGPVTFPDSEVNEMNF